MQQSHVSTFHKCQSAPICILFSYTVAVGLYAHTTAEEGILNFCSEERTFPTDFLQAQWAAFGLFSGRQERLQKYGYECLEQLHNSGQQLYFRIVRAQCECKLGNFTENDLSDELAKNDQVVALVALGNTKPLEAHSMVVTYDSTQKQVVVSDPNQGSVCAVKNIRDAIKNQPYATWSWGHQLMFRPT